MAGIDDIQTGCHVLLDPSGVERTSLIIHERRDPVLVGRTPPRQCPRSNGANDPTVEVCPQDDPDWAISEVFQGLQQCVPCFGCRPVQRTYDHDRRLVPHASVPRKANDLSGVIYFETIIAKGIGDEPSQSPGMGDSLSTRTGSVKQNRGHAPRTLRSRFRSVSGARIISEPCAEAVPALLTAVVDGSPSSLLGWDVRNHQDLGLIAVTEFTGSTRDPLNLSDRLLHTVAELAHWSLLLMGGSTRQR